jgi:peptidoglycan/xylan/chitin deacetylase (PgdA/CDA1 family)
MFVCTEHLGSGREFAHDLRAGEPGFPPLSWAQLARMHQDGFEVGSHTRTHFDCGSCDRARLADEIVGSRRELEQGLGVTVETFSFPGGLPRNISQEATDLAAASYRYVLSAFGGRNAPGDARHLKRAFHVGDRWELELQIQGVLEREPPFTFRPTPTSGGATLVSLAHGA